jgi:RNA polymerase sigma-70 factor (ECF subfamily)
MNGRVAMGEATSALPASLAPETVARPHAPSFDAIFIEHYPRVVGIIARMVSDRSRAEQLAADVFWKLYRKRLFRPREDNIGGWLYRTALRVGLDALRTASRRSRHEASAAVEQVRQAGPCDPLEAVLQAERRAQVRATLATLKPRQARLLLLRGCGLSYQQIAGVLKINPTSVGTLLARAEDAFERQHRALHGSKS